MSRLEECKAEITRRILKGIGFRIALAQLGAKGSAVRGNVEEAQHMDRRPIALMLHDKGMSEPSIAARLDVNHTTVKNWLRGKLKGGSR